MMGIHLAWTFLTFHADYIKVDVADREQFWIRITTGFYILPILA